MKKKTKRKVHIDDNVWYWWIGKGRFGEASSVTICSPSDNYYNINPNDVCETKMYVGVEGESPTNITPSRIKDYIIENGLN